MSDNRLEHTAAIIGLANELANVYNEFRGELWTQFFTFITQDIVSHSAVSNIFAITVNVIW